MIKTNFENNEVFLLVDTSYVVHALCATALNKYSEQGFVVPKDQEELYKIDFSKDEEYLSIFTEIFINNVKKYCKQFLIKGSCVVFAKDCNKLDIWRRTIYPEYKEHRLIPEKKGIWKGPIFKFVFDKLLPLLETKHFGKVISATGAEGDDVIAVLKMYLREQYPSNKIIIVGSDHDMLQMLDDHTIYINIQNEILNEKSEGPEKELKLKIILGDGGDNIPAIFEKVKGDKVLGRGCGKGTATKLRDDPQLLQDKLLQYPEAVEKMKLNEQLIDFKNIPVAIRESIIKEYEKHGECS
jgi:5'-3' exonuclease